MASVVYISPSLLKSPLPVTIDIHSADKIAAGQSGQEQASNALLQSIVDAIEEDGLRRARRGAEEVGTETEGDTETEEGTGRERRQAQTKSLRAKITANDVPAKGVQVGTDNVVPIAVNEHGYLQLGRIQASNNSILMYGMADGGSIVDVLKTDGNGHLKIAGTITAENLDVALSHTGDSVTVYGSDQSAPIKTDSSGHVQVDIQSGTVSAQITNAVSAHVTNAISVGVTSAPALTAATDSVKVYGSDANAPIKTDSSGHVQVDIVTDQALSNDADNILVYGWDGLVNQKIKTDDSGHVKVSIQSGLVSAAISNTADVAIRNAISVGVTSVPALTAATDSVKVYGSDANAPIKTDSSGHVQVDIVTDQALSNDADNILVYGWDGLANQKIKTDTDGNLQVDILSMPAISVTPASESTDDILVYGWTGAANQKIKTDSNGRLEVATADGADLDIRALTRAIDAITVYGSDTSAPIKTDSSGHVQVDIVTDQALSNDADNILVYGWDGSSNQKIKTDTSGRVDNVGGVVSTGNTGSTGTIAASDTWYGTWEDVNEYASISVIADKASGVSATATLYGEFSYAGTPTAGGSCTGDNPPCRSIQCSSGTDVSFGIHLVIPVATYFRLRIVNNDGSNSLVVNTQVIYNKQSRIAQPTSRLQQTLGGYSDVLNTRAVLAAVDENGAYRTLHSDSEGNLQANIVSPQSAFSSLLTESLSPEVQLNFVFGINLRQVHEEDSGTTGAAVSAANSLVTLSTGTDATGYALLESRRLIRYRPGQGILARFTTIFGTCDTSAVSTVGIGNSANGFYFGCGGTGSGNDHFGVFRRTGGLPETVVFEITNAAVTAGGTITFTLPDTKTHAVEVTQNDGVDIIAATAAETAPPAGWNVFARDAFVYFYTDTPRAETTVSASFADTDTTGTTADATNPVDGVAPTDTFIPTTSWNIDMLDGSGSSGTTIDTTKGNVFQIQYQWLGFGAITFFVETATGKFQPVHRIRYANNATSVSLDQPTGHIHAHIKNVNGGTTNHEISGASFAGFVEGNIILLNPPSSASSTATTPVSEYLVIALRNDPLFGFGSVLRENTAEVYPKDVTLSFSGTGNPRLSVSIFKDGTPSPNLVLFQQQTDSPASVAQSDADITFTSTVPIYQTTMELGTTITVPFTDSLRLAPGETLYISAADSGSGNTVDVVINWIDDL